MRKDILDIAEKVHAVGLMPIPVNPSTKLTYEISYFGKVSKVGYYKQGYIANFEQVKKVLTKAKGVALACGIGGLEALDIEGKFDSSGMIYEKVKDMIIRQIGLDFFNKLVVQNTQNGGNHIFYRCKEAVNNTKWKSKVITANRQRKCLIETRSNPSYSIIAPSQGYKLIQGQYELIPRISKAEYFTIHSICADIHAHEQQFIGT